MAVAAASLLSTVKDVSHVSSGVKRLANNLTSAALIDPKVVSKINW